MKNRVRIELTCVITLFAAFLAAVSPVADAADDQQLDVDTAPISESLLASPQDVQRYNDHVVTLANPFFEGRLPGTRGAAIAAEYIEFYFRQAGLEPLEASGNLIGYRQPFIYGSRLEPSMQKLTVHGPEGDMTFRPGTDFAVTPLGRNGNIIGPLVFVGYAIENGMYGYKSFDRETDLTGKIAVMLRFEPMDVHGSSIWSEGSRWSERSWFKRKLDAVASRGAAGVLILNVPGADDPDADSLAVPDAGREALDIPVLLVNIESSDRFMNALDPQGRSILQLRRAMDKKGAVFTLNGTASIASEIQRVANEGENILGVLPGAGALANEYIVVGAHYDHLGKGRFGSRAGAGRLHPGADDNASGTAGLILLAEKIAEEAKLQRGDRRSIIFAAFSAEESGLHGSRHFVEKPPVGLDAIDLMINFDMIGRIEGGRLTVAGTRTARDFASWLKPHFSNSSLHVDRPQGVSGRSDHAPFHNKGIPILFAMIGDMHEDYHTPGDVSAKVNRHAAVEAVRLFESILNAAATRAGRLEFTGTIAQEEAPKGGSRMGAMKIRFGISPGSYDDTEPGVLVGQVFEKTSASLGGVLAGDRLQTWNGTIIRDVRHWMELMSVHEPGDVATVGVLRGDEPIELKIKLFARAKAN